MVRPVRAGRPRALFGADEGTSLCLRLVGCDRRSCPAAERARDSDETAGATGVPTLWRLEHVEKCRALGAAGTRRDADWPCCRPNGAVAVIRFGETTLKTAFAAPKRIEVTSTNDARDRHHVALLAALLELRGEAERNGFHLSCARFGSRTIECFEKLGGTRFCRLYVRGCAL